MDVDDTSQSSSSSWGSDSCMSKVILVVDDEEHLLEMLEYNLLREGYVTRSAKTGVEALALANQIPIPAAVILDLMLPDISGVEVCRRLKSSLNTRHVPIIMVSARGDEIDRVVGFEVGADDYVVKPFSVRELMLRVHSRVRDRPYKPVVEPKPKPQFGRLIVDEEGHRVWVEEREVILTGLEFRLLVTLFSRRGRVQTREQLLQDVWGVLADVTSRTVDTHVKRLRRKLGIAGQYIETLRGTGYRFCSNEPSNEPEHSNSSLTV